MELAFAGLQQLCAPLLDGALERLPGPQREALATAFGLRAGAAPDRFLVGLGVLTLLSEVCADEPLVCVIDDAQWLDRSPRRRWRSSRAACWRSRSRSCSRCASRARRTSCAGFRSCWWKAWATSDARALLASVLTGPLDAGVRERILDETHGNPLALLELPRGLSSAELAGGFGLPDAAALPGRIEANSSGAWRRCPRTRGGCSCWRQRTRPAIPCWCGGPPAARDRGGGGCTGGRGRADRRSAGRSGSITRWCAPRSTGPRRRPSGRSRTARWPRWWTPSWTPIGGPGIARTRRPASTRTWPPSSSIRPAGRGRGRARRGGRVLRARRRAHAGAAPAGAPSARRGPGQAPGRCPGRGDPPAGAGARGPARRARQRPGGAAGGTDRVRRRPWSRGAAAVAEGRQAAGSAGRRARPRDLPRRVRGGAVRGPARRWERCARGGRGGASGDLGRVGAAVAARVRAAAGRAGGPRDGRVRRGRPDAEAGAARVPRGADVGGGRPAVAVARVPRRARPG